MRPSDLYEQMSDELTSVVKAPFRDAPLTNEELDLIADKILVLIEREKAGLQPLQPALREKP